MSMAILVTILYFLPITYIAYLGYSDAKNDFETKKSEKWENTVISFADWFFMILKRSDLGMTGLIISILIHV